jgi:hypothetical protein
MEAKVHDQSFRLLGLGAQAKRTPRFLFQEAIFIHEMVLDTTTRGICIIGATEQKQEQETTTTTTTTTTAATITRTTVWPSVGLARIKPWFFWFACDREGCDVCQKL